MQLSTILIDLLVLAIFGAAIYSFLILPRQREFRRRQKVVADLTPGTRVTTYGGIIGTVIEVRPDEGLVTLEIADGVRVDVVGPAIIGEFDAAGVAGSSRRALGRGRTGRQE
jgi:preprotein translocase YajC subunit